MSNLPTGNFANSQNAVSAATRSQALAQLGNPLLKSQGDKVVDICLGVQRNGGSDLSGREIQSLWELLHGTRIESGTVSRIVGNLVAAGRLERLTFSRACTITGRDIAPVRVPATQARLVY